MMISCEVPKFEIDGEGLPEVDCDYISPDQVYNKIKSPRNNNFSLFHLNIRSFRKNIDSLITFLNTYLIYFTVIILTETWLTESINPPNLMNGYNQIDLFRNSHGGGIKILYRDFLSVDIVNEMTFLINELEICSFYLLGRSFKYLICSVYRPPSSSVRRFDYFSENVLNRLPLEKDVVFVGDFNVNLYNPLNMNVISDFINLMLQFNFFPVINKATIFHPNNSITKYSLIDQIWCNFFTGTNHFGGIIEFQISDHLPIFYAFQNSFNFFKTKLIKYRIINSQNIDNFVNAIYDIDFSNVMSFSNNDVAFTKFYNLLFNTYKSSFPIKKRKIKSNICGQPWVTPDLKYCIRKKYRLYNLLKRGFITRHHFRNYSNILRNVIRLVKKNFYFKRFSHCQNKSKETWKNINGIMNRKVNKEIDRMSDVNDNNIYTGLPMVNFINDYFSSVVSGLVANLSFSSDCSFLDTIKQNSSSFCLYPTNEAEVASVILSLEDKGNTLYIKPSFFKLIIDKIVYILTYLINFSFQSAIYPEYLLYINQVTYCM